MMGLVTLAFSTLTAFTSWISVKTSPSGSKPPKCSLNVHTIQPYLSSPDQGKVKCLCTHWAEHLKANARV